MRHKTTAISYFFFSQALADGLRITFSILAPVLFFRHIGMFEMGLAISLGAICVNITDIPGPMIHKRNGLLVASALIFLASMISGLFHIHVVLTALIIGAFTFFLTLFAVYGIRAASVGSAALLVLILSMSHETQSFREVLLRSTLVGAGALWYSAISLLLSTMRPYRMAQRALGECIRETAKFLSMKAEFYNPKTGLENNYRNLLSQQVIVNEKQNELRELLFKTRQIVKDSSGTGRSLMLTFVETVDLYEQILASYYNYDAIREKYGHSGILKKISWLIRRMSFELNDIGFAIQSNLAYKKDPRLSKKIEELRTFAANVKLGNPEDQLVLQKITDNMDTIYHSIHELSNYFDTGIPEKPGRPIEHKPFVNHQDYSPEVFIDNFTFQSSAFRHSLRVSIACLAGFIVAHLLNYGNHSYWILITLVFIMKPAFGLTKKRNIERLAGTAAGGIIGIIVLYFFRDPQVEFAFLLFLMVGTYTFMRINYIAMVIFTTPYVLIMFKLLGSGYMSVIEERIIDTGIGCSIALLAGYLLFPKWEAEELEDHIRHVLNANLSYLENFRLMVSGRSPGLVNYKLARKEVFISSANLSAAFQRMLSEPRKKRRNSDKVYEFVVLNHVLSSNIAGLSADTLSENTAACSVEELKILEKIRQELQACLDEKIILKEAGEPLPRETTACANNPGLKQQLEFILRLSTDIYKARKEIRVAD
ncbi:MAG: hypothetical protein JWO44_176 [Bacteroidetes bacterium]|nr:hypothetical protein [Bacteroidota bacterium]